MKVVPSFAFKLSFVTRTDSFPFWPITRYGKLFVVMNDLPYRVIFLLQIDELLQQFVLKTNRLAFHQSAPVLHNELVYILGPMQK